LVCRADDFYRNRFRLRGQPIDISQRSPRRFDCHFKYDRLPDRHLRGKPLAQFFRDLRTEIAADQTKLQALVEKFDKEHDAIRKAGAWITEKLSRAKIRPGESRDGEMGLYLALESLVLGITGKCALWRGLEIAAGVVPELHGLDYAQLQERAREQCDRVETKRLGTRPGGLQTRKAITRALQGQNVKHSSSLSRHL